MTALTIVLMVAVYLCLRRLSRYIYALTSDRPPAVDAEVLAFADLPPDSAAALDEAALSAALVAGQLDPESYRLAMERLAAEDARPIISPPS